MSNLKTHRVKSWMYLYQSVLDGEKKHDFRNKDERDYKVGDTLVLCEYDQTKGTFTGRELPCKITYKTDSSTPCAMSSTALGKEFTVLSIEPIIK